MFLLSMKKNVQIEDRGVTGYQILGGQSVMWRAAAGRRLLLFCQKLGGQLPTLPTMAIRVVEFSNGGTLQYLKPKCDNVKIS